MSKLMDFLMKGNDAEPVIAEAEISGFPMPFTIHSITLGENNTIRRACQKTVLDKRTHQKTVETDTDLYNNRLVAACCTDPNFKDAELQKHYGVIGAEALIEAVLKPGQFIDLLLAVQEVNGFGEDMNDLKEEAKN